MKKYFFLFFIAAGLLTSCQDSHSSHSDPAHESAHQHGADNMTDGVKLNDGQKWEANAETTEGISRMRSLVQGTGENSSAEEYKAFQASLDKEFTEILQKCTMKGEAHDQLHNYLLPLKDLIGDLTVSTPEESSKVAKQLDSYLKQYGNYFQ